MDIRKHYQNVEQQLDSSSLCLAKWQQVTLHLQIGHNHSCHHPKTHIIPLDELKANPSALHNTKFKQKQRQAMLTGTRPSECDYCWRVEDSNKDKNVFSDRITKSSEHWSLPHLDKIRKGNGSEFVNPSYVEVSFSNVCNFKCSYCAPEISSKWMEEIKQHGGYPTSGNFNNLEWIKKQGKMPIPHNQQNPYVDAFWKWWPELYKDLKVFRITGGEPLLAKDTFKVLDYIIDNPNPNLELNINSNLGIPSDILDKFIEKMKRIQGEGLIKEFKLYTSCEGSGERAEYMRHGLNYKEWLESCRQVLSELPQSKLTVMSAYNALSVTSYQDFMKDFLDLRTEFNTGQDRRNPVGIDMPYLRYPWHQAIFILDQTYLKKVEEQVTWMFHNKEHAFWPPLCGIGFYDHEINRMQRLYNVMRDGLEYPDKTQHRKDFVSFFDEHDRRRGTNFLKTFPEMADFYYMCKEL